MLQTHQTWKQAPRWWTCLLSIMRHCSSDARGLCSAARAHSSLRSAAAAAHTSITLDVEYPRQISSLLRCLAAHGQHVRHLHLSSGVFGTIGLAPLQFPPSVQLESLALADLRVAVSTDSDGQHSLGILVGQSRLQTLSLKDCTIDTTEDGLAAALRQLPALQHLAVTGLLWQALDPCGPKDILPFPGEVLSGLGLTRLELGWETLAGGPADLIAVDLRHISTLTALDDLHICSGLPEGRDAPSDSEDEPTAAFTASMLQPLSRRTSLQLDGDGADVFVEFEPHALRGKPSMQHLSLPFVYFEVDGQPDESAVFAELRQLRELTHLDLQRSFFGAPDGSVLPAAACTSLAASSKLQHLDISSNTFPLGLWRELFNPSRQLLQLQVLDIARTNYKSLHEDSDLLLTAADAQRLASCCPGLQHLSAYRTLRDTAAVAALSPLSSSLRTLLLAGTGVPWAKLRNVAGTGWAKAVAQLPSLENLDVTLPVQGEEMERAWVHLKPVLQHLTRLEIWDDNRKSLAFKCKDPGDKPVSHRLRQQVALHSVRSTLAWLQQ